MTTPPRHRLQITEGMRRFLDYPRFAGATRLLILETGYFFDDSWERAARQLGWEVARVKSAMTGDLLREDIKQLFTTIGSFKPDFALTSNLAGMDAHGIFANFFEDARLPYVSWFTDTPRMILLGRELGGGDYAVAASWERAYQRELERAGFRHTFFMPHATDPHLFNGTFEEDAARSLSFVGMSMREQAREALDKHQHRPQLVQAVRDAVEAGIVTRDRYPEGPGAMLDAPLLTGLDASDLRNLELFLNYEATRNAREALARTLAPLGLEVRGDSGWRAVLEKVGGALGYFDDLAPYYRSSAVNVNQTAIQMRWAVNQRVFDCPAAGGFLLTDAQEDLAELFAPEEVVSYASLEELEDKAAYFVRNPAERRRVVERAQHRILSEHTHVHRLSSLERYLKQLYA